MKGVVSIFSFKIFYVFFESIFQSCVCVWTHEFVEIFEWIRVKFWVEHVLVADHELGRGIFRFIFLGWFLFFY